MTRLSNGLLLAALLALGISTPARAQAFRWPENPKNLKVLPDSVRGLRLGAVMRGFAIGLGVRCEFCHVGEGDLATFDFAADDKPAKQKARVMIEMVQAINGRHLGALEPLGVSPDHRVEVTCETCHRGISRPVPLDALLLATIDSAGADAGLAQYGTLRERYYGSAAYDFSRGVLTSVGDQLVERSRFADAVTILKLELETNGEDVRTLVTLGSAEVQAGNRAAGLEHLQRALTIAPAGSKPFVQRQIDRITKP
jgi:hypothetical protein